MKFFFTAGITASLESLRHQEAVGRDAQRGVMVKPAPAPSLIVAQSEVLLQILVIPLDAPTHFGDEHHLRQGGLLWRGGEEVFRWWVFRTTVNTHSGGS